MNKRAVRYPAAAGSGFLSAFAVMCCVGIFTAADVAEVMRRLSNAFFASGALLICAGVLVFTADRGAFDMLAYAVISVFDCLRRDVKKRKYRDFYAYRRAKSDKKHPCGFLSAAGACMAFVSLIFLALYYNV